MYKVKRFSQVRQKNYGLLGDLRHSGLKRSYKKYVGEARRAVGDRIGKKVNELIKDNNESINLSIGIPFNKSPFREIMNPKVSRDIIKRNAKKNGVRMMRSNNPYISEISKASEVNEEILRDKHKITNSRQIKKVMNAVRSGDDIIFLGKSYGRSPDVIAHELGHAKNYHSKNPITKLSHKVTSSMHEPLNNDKGLYQIAKHAIKNRALVKEESNASKSAIKMMKEAGASKDEIRQGKINLNLALDTYKSAEKLDNSNMIYKAIQIPSRSDISKSNMLDEIRRIKSKRRS